MKKKNENIVQFNLINLAIFICLITFVRNIIVSCSLLVPFRWFPYEYIFDAWDAFEIMSFFFWGGILYLIKHTKMQFFDQCHKQNQLQAIN